MTHDTATHIHDADPPLQKKNWNDAELTKAKQLREQGLEYKEIAEILGRTEKSVESKFTYERMTEPQREHRRALIRSYRRNAELEPIAPSSFRAVEQTKASPEAIADRNARLMAPKSLSAWLMGDPPFIQSALAKRGMSA